jgi:hypothetical protein
MSQIYKTQALMEQGVDFSSIYKDKQSVVKEMLGFDFDVSEIVDFLQAETGNFSKQSDLALDLDKNIYMLYTSWIEKEKAGKEEEEEEESTTPETEEKNKIEKELLDLNGLKDFVEGDELEKINKEIEDLEGLLLVI